MVKDAGLWNDLFLKRKVRPKEKDVEKPGDRGSNAPFSFEKEKRARKRKLSWVLESPRGAIFISS